MSIDELTAKLDASDAKIAELTALNSEFEKENISLTAKVNDLTHGAEQSAIQIAKLESDATAASEAHSAELAKLNAELAESKKETATLREQTARFGAPAPKKGGATTKEEAPVISRQDFTKLSPAEQREFILTKRGKVQD